uniref:NLPC_P60 domain-containing protein n=1 Tax=Caenorhabditis tropicalis TaxID=1561998 RepID=A0A1I7T9Q8_9PELO
MSHGAKCICQICTCGRHKCPHDRNASSFQLGDGKSHLSQEKKITQTAFESSSYQKSERATPTRHHSTLSSLFTEENSTGNVGTHTRTIKSAEYRETRRNGEQLVIEKRESQKETTHLPPIETPKTSRTSVLTGKERNSRTSIQQALQQNEINSAGNRKQETKTPTKKTVTINEEKAGYQKTYRNSSQIFEARRLHQQSESRDSSSSGISVDKTKGQTDEKTDNQQHSQIGVQKGSNRKTTSGETISDAQKKESTKNASATSQTVNQQSSPRIGVKSVASHRQSTSDVLNRSAGYSMTRTENQEDFIHRHAEKQSRKVPVDHQIIVKETNETPKRAESFKYVGSARYAKKVPADNKILQGDGQQFEAKTQNQEDFTHINGERYAKKVPADSKILQGDGQQFEARTQNQEDFTHISGERYAKKVPADNKILQGDGQQFEARTQNQEDFTYVSGERYAKKVPADNKILQGDGQQFEARTQNQEDFTYVSGERYAKKVPADNKILQGGGQQFEAKTQNQEDFTRKKGERVVINVPIDHKFMNTENQQFASQTISHEDFVDFSSDIVAESGIILEKKLSNNASSRGRSHVYETTTILEDSDSGFEGYLITSGSKSTSSHVGYPSQNDGSSYDIDYQYRPVPCIAGELLESVRRNHVNTEHYNFNACDSGHHFYREKTILEEDETTETEKTDSK